MDRGAGGAGSQERQASGPEAKQTAPQNAASAPGSQPMEGVENSDGKTVNSEQRRPEGWIVIDDDHAEPKSNGADNNSATPQRNSPNAQSEGECRSTE